MNETTNRQTERHIEKIVQAAPTDQEAMLDGIYQYFSTGQVYGHFLTALLTNDFARTVTSADSHNSERISEWAIWLWNDVPRNAWGSTKTVDAYTGLGFQ